MKSWLRDRHRAHFWPRVVLITQIWIALCLLLCPGLAHAQNWQSNFTNFNATLPILLTDGTVICQDTETSNWWKLTPDAFGSYVNGTWTQIASMPSGYGPLYYASAVLADGRVVVLGGEYNVSSGDNTADTKLGAIYDPVANKWTTLAGPPGWNNIGDASCAVLPDGTFLLANQFGSNGALLNPTTLTWTARSFTNKSDPNAEEGWTLLVDGTILTVCTENGTHSERYNPLTDTWTSAGSTIVTLPAAPPGDVPEMGPQVLRPDGTVIAFGASIHNSLYNPLTNTWTPAPDFPNGLDVADGPACLLPNGNVFVGASPGIFNPGEQFFEFDGTNLISEPATNYNAPDISTYFTNMMMLPTGQVMFTYTANEVEIYTSTGSPNAAWLPTITSCPTTVAPGSTYTIFGTQFNGLSQTSAYGDDSSNATNYPLVRITNHATGHVIYFRTHNHSTMAVATGSTIVSTHFDVPSTVETGPADLVVVANGIASAPFTITVGTGVGTPTANPQSVSVAHNTATGITLTGTDPDMPALPLTFAIATSPAHGALSGFNASTGTVTYTPNSNFQGTDTFTFTVNNGTNTSSPATVTLTVAPGVPTATAQSVNVAHNTATGITLTGTDPDSPALPLTFAIGTSPTNGVLSGFNASTGVVTYTPNAGYSGADSFTFTVSNGTNTSAPATVTLTVAVGTPTANAQAVSVAHNTATGITLTGTDSNTPPLTLTFNLGSSPAHGMLSGFNSTTGAVTYTPNTNYYGTDSFTFSVTNSAGLTSSPAIVTLNVAVGTPTANPQTVSVAHNTATGITLTGTDPDTPALTLTFAIGASPTNGVLSGFNASTGAVTYTPNSNFQGTDTFTFTVSNGTNTSAPATVTLTVGVGTPTANAQSVSVAHNTATGITLTGTDPDSPALPLTFAIGASPTNGVLSGFNASTGAVTYTPNTGYAGADSFTFTVSNGTNTSAPATVTLTVASGVPTANAQSVSVARNNTATGITLTGTDPDTPALPLTFAIGASPAHGVLTGFNATTGTVTYTPNANFQGTDSFTFTVSNGTNTSAPATVTLTVAPGVPTANAQTINVAHNVATGITLTGTDPDSPALPLTFAIGTGPAHGVLTGFNASTGAVTYTPNSNYQGPDSFTFTVNNGTNTSAPATVTLNVGIGTPTANPQTVSVAHNTATGITLSGTDPDSPALPLTFALGASPAHGVLTGFNASTGAVTYTPNSNYQGTDTFTFTVSNGTNTSAPATVTLTVAPGVPTANVQSVNVAQNTATGITLSGTDPDSPALSLTFAIGTGPTNGVLTGFNASTGAVTYTPNAGYHGTDTFTFTVSNGTNTSAPATVTLTVGVGTPTANAQTVSLNQDTALGITLTGTDPDSPALPLTFALGASPAHGVLTGFNATTGAVTYTPNAGYSGTDSFTFTVSNGTNTSATATVTINVAQTLFDVSSQVSITRGVFQIQRSNGTYYQVLTLKNTGTTTINGPISLILSSLANATLFNPTGTTSALLPAGRPYVNLGVSSLAPGATTTVTLYFTKIGTAAITYNTQVVAGPGAR